MADKELRLRISTALDAAGIKATQQQLAGLEQQLSKVDAGGGSAESSLKKLGKLKGQLGPLQDMFEGVGGALGRIGGAATMAIAAFKAGWDIGSWVNDKVITPLFGIKDAQEELVKANRRAKAAHEEAMKSMARADEQAARAQTEAIAALDLETRKLAGLRNAALAAAKAKSEMANADKDIEVQMLQRRRWEDVTTLRDEGDEEGARQAELAYDIMTKQLEAKKAMAKFDQDAAAEMTKIEAADEKINRLREKRAEYQREEARLAARAKEIDETAASSKEWQELTAKNDAAKAANARALASVNNDLLVAKSERRALDPLEATLVKRRALLADQQQMGVDEAAMAWQRHYMANGDMLGWTPDDKMVKALTDASREAQRGLVEALAQGVAEGIGRLMEVKQ